MDTLTSMLAGLIVFGVIGHLAHVLEAPDIKHVVRGGAGLAFITYPDAIAKFTFWPQFFAIAFFLMLFVLGIGSNVGMATTIMTVIRDRFPQLQPALVAVGIAIVGYGIGIIYTTPGGQYVLDFLDFYGASFVALVLAVFEMFTFAWIYGVSRICRDIEFMLGIKTGLYWRICWGFITPTLLAAILLYHIATYETFTFNGYVYPDGMYGEATREEATYLETKKKHSKITCFLSQSYSLWMVYLCCRRAATARLGDLHLPQAQGAGLARSSAALLQTNARLGPGRPRTECQVSRVGVQTRTITAAGSFASAKDVRQRVQLK